MRHHLIYGAIIAVLSAAITYFFTVPPPDVQAETELDARTPGTIVARRFVLVDDQGQVWGEWAWTDEGSMGPRAKLEVRDPNKNSRAWLRVWETASDLFLFSEGAPPAMFQSSGMDGKCRLNGRVTHENEN
jgi:hypothetical protein